MVSKAEEVFRSEGVQLLRNVREQAMTMDEKGKLPNCNFTFGDCLLLWSNNQFAFVGGVIHVCKTKTNSLKFLMGFTTPNKFLKNSSSSRSLDGGCLINVKFCVCG